MQPSQSDASSSSSDLELGKASIDTANGYLGNRIQVAKPSPHNSLPEDDSSDSDDELPITANRHARWWYSIFHNVTAMIGAGVLGLPAAFKYLGTPVVAFCNITSSAHVGESHVPSLQAGLGALWF